MINCLELFTLRFGLMIAVLFTLMSSSVANGASKLERVSFPSNDGTSITGYVYKPGASGPYPAIIAMHGCAGLFQGKKGNKFLASRSDWASRFLKAGYVVLFPDSNGSRGFRSLCETKPQAYPIKLRHQVADLIGAADWIAGQPFVDATNTAVVGWGTGGTAALRIFAPKFSDPARPDFKSGIAFYPHCDWLDSKTKFTPRLLPTILIGAADDLTPAAPCKSLAERWGSPIELYKGAYHSFDAPNRRLRKNRYGSNVAHAGTNTAARNKAIKQVMMVLADNFK